MQILFLKPNKFFPQLDVDLLPLKLFNIKHLPYAQHGTGDTEKVTDKFLALGKKKQTNIISFHSEPLIPSEVTCPSPCPMSLWLWTETRLRAQVPRDGL